MEKNITKDNYSVFSFKARLVRLSFAKLLWPYYSHLAMGLLVLLITNLISAFLPRLINIGVELTQSKKPAEFDYYFSSFSLDLLSLIFFIVFLSLIGIFIRTMSRIFLFNVGRNIEKDIREILYGHLSLQDEHFFQNHTVGDLINHLTNDIANIRFIAGFSILNVANIIFCVILTVPLLIEINLKLALIALLPFPLMILATKILSHKIFLSTKDYQEKVSNLVSHVQENLLLSQLIRIFHRQEYEVNRFNSTNFDAYLSALKFSRLRIIMYPITRLVLGLSIGLILLFGLTDVLNKVISLGDFVEFNSRIFQLVWPFMSIGYVISSYNRGMASLERINKILAKRPKIIDGEQKIQTIDKIDIVDLVINRQSNANGKINLKITKGQTIGIVGPTGSYKSTLLNILSRRKPIDFGNVFINEIDVNNISLDSIANLMSVVPQETFLFHTTVRENICFARDNISEEEVNNILKVTALDKDIEYFEEGLDTMVGERGVTLSGGQRQRIALARALLAKKPVLILDDALSSVDSTTEKHIIKELAKLKDISIKIIATNKLSEVKSADIIFVLENGEIVASGKHEELLDHSTTYNELLGIRN